MKLICYLSNGYPSLEESVTLAKEYVDGGCDIIEVDLPAPNPYLEGELISNRMKTALEKCSDYDRYMENILIIKQQNPTTKIILLSYESTILEIGEAKFIHFCLENNLKDMIIVGHDGGDLKTRLMKQGLQISCYVQYHLPIDEVEAAKKANGFVYMQAKPVTGNINPCFPDLKNCLDHLKQQGITRSFYCGVGVYTPSDVKMVKEAGGDGVFVGSAILKHDEDIAKMKQVIAAFKQATQE